MENLIKIQAIVSNLEELTAMRKHKSEFSYLNPNTLEITCKTSNCSFIT